MLCLGQENVVEKPPSEIELAGLLEEAEVMVESSDKFELTSYSFPQSECCVTAIEMSSKIACNLIPRLLAILIGWYLFGMFFLLLLYAACFNDSEAKEIYVLTYVVFITSLLLMATGIIGSIRMFCFCFPLFMLNLPVLSFSGSFNSLSGSTNIPLSLLVVLNTIIAFCATQPYLCLKRRREGDLQETLKSAAGSSTGSIV